MPIDINEKNPSPSDICEILHICSEKMRRFVAYKDNRRLRGLTLSQIEILHYVDKNPNGTMLKKMIQEFGISKSLASQSISRLIKRGYLRKIRSDEDSRNIVIYPTKKLENINNRIRKISQEYFFPAITRIPKGDRKSLFRIMNALHKNLNKDLL